MDTFITTRFNEVALIVSIIMFGIGMLISVSGAFFYFTVKRDDIGTKKNLFKLVIKVGIMIVMLSTLGIVAAYILN